MTHIFRYFYLRSVSIAFENLKHGFVNANSNASLSNVNLFNVFAFVSIRSDGPIDVSFSLKSFFNISKSDVGDIVVDGDRFDIEAKRSVVPWFIRLLTGWL